MGLPDKSRTPSSVSLDEVRGGSVEEFPLPRERVDPIQAQWLCSLRAYFLRPSRPIEKLGAFHWLDGRGCSFLAGRPAELRCLPDLYGEHQYFFSGRESWSHRPNRNRVRVACLRCWFSTFWISRSL